MYREDIIERLVAGGPRLAGSGSEPAPATSDQEESDFELARRLQEEELGTDDASGLDQVSLVASGSLFSSDMFSIHLTADAGTVTFGGEVVQGLLSMV